MGYFTKLLSANHFGIVAPLSADCQDSSPSRGVKKVVNCLGVHQLVLSVEEWWRVCRPSVLETFLTWTSSVLPSSHSDMKWSIVITAMSAMATVSAREAKWFLPKATVTRFVQEQRFVTELMTSSCVVLETSLKPCRHLRQIQPTTTSPHPPKIVMTATPRLEGSAVPSIRGSWEEPTAAPYQSWSSYFGLGPVTVLRTVTQLVTAGLTSPLAMVTFSVRGCQPSRLPFGLPLCSEPNITARISTTKDVHYVEE